MDNTNIRYRGPVVVTVEPVAESIERPDRCRLNVNWSRVAGLVIAATSFVASLPHLASVWQPGSWREVCASGWPWCRQKHWEHIPPEFHLRHLVPLALSILLVTCAVKGSAGMRKMNWRHLAGTAAIFAGTAAGVALEIFSIVFLVRSLGANSWQKGWEEVRNDKMAFLLMKTIGLGMATVLSTVYRVSVACSMKPPRARV